MEHVIFGTTPGSKPHQINASIDDIKKAAGDPQGNTVVKKPTNA
jgi:hypothetical protein